MGYAQIGESMPDGIGRRRFLKYTAAGVVAAAATAGAYYYLGRVPQPIVSQTSTAIASPTSTTTRANPVVDYAEQKGLESQVIEKLEHLGYDGILDRNEEALIDFLADIDKAVPSEDAHRADKIRDLRVKAVDEVLADGLSDAEGESLGFLRSFSPKTQRIYVEFGLDKGTIEYLLYVSTLPDAVFARWAAERKLCFQKRSLTDLDRTFLHEPSTHAKQVMQAYIEDAHKQVTYTDLAAEIQKIPEVKAGIKSGSIEDLEAVEDLVYGAIQASPDGVRFLQEALNEGVPAKRKYCAPLQALLWYAYDCELDVDQMFTITNYAAGISVFDLVELAWTKTTASDGYRSHRWKRFDDVVDRLSSPRLLFLYMSKNFTYFTTEPWRDFSPKEVFERRSGDCWTTSAFAMHVLTENGYEAYILGVDWAEGYTWGHKACMYREEGSWYFLDNFAIQGIFGPFTSIEEAASMLHQNCRSAHVTPYPGDKYKIHVWNSRKELIMTILVGF